MNSKGLLLDKVAHPSEPSGRDNKFSGCEIWLLVVASNEGYCAALNQDEAGREAVIAYAISLLTVEEKTSRLQNRKYVVVCKS
ncbi:hypothetical protein J6590_007852 [Homalodisca vitripennis]|nr:hypothetical protein J6590_007852 [Homalodisca vitripennis]